MRISRVSTLTQDGFFYPDLLLVDEVRVHNLLANALTMKNRRRKPPRGENRGREAL